jgi:hypothetical protein
MGLYTTPSSYSGNSAAPWANGINGIGRAFMQAPAMQAMAKQREEQAALLQQQQSLTQARTQAETARAGKLTAETGALDADEQSAQRLGAVFKRILANPEDTDAQGDAMIEAGRFFKKNPEQGSKALENLIASMKALGTNANPEQIALLQRGATSMVNKKAEIAANPNMVVQPGAAVIPRTMKPGEQPIFRNPSAASAEAAYETTTQEIPAVAAQEADITPAYQPGVIKRFFGAEPRPAVTNSPAIPATPATKITRKTPIDLGAALQRGAAGQAPAAATPTGGKVRVQHPGGSFGYIPAEQVQDALSQGFKLAPQ